MLTAEGTNRYHHQLKKGLTAILQIFEGTLPLSADPGKVFFFKNSILMQSFRHRRQATPVCNLPVLSRFKESYPLLCVFAALVP
jgi:hypothetical protein